MGKVRFSCPRCKAVMQTSDDKIGFDIACPQCSHQFTLVGQSTAAPTSSPPESSQGATDADSNPAVEATRQWVDTTVDGPRAEPTTTYTPPAAESTRKGSSIPPIYQGTSNSFSCPYCQSRQPPIWKSEVSTVGWITCVILACTTCVFFWVGLLIRDKYTICSSCKTRLPRTFS